MKKFKISVIVPVYNAASYLDKCLDSILNQTYKDFELILINDGSTDKSLDIINNYQQQNIDKIKVINQENLGAAKARNIGIELAVGEFICFIDADDYIDKTMLQKMYEKAKNENLSLVWCSIQEIRNGVKTIITKNFNTDTKKNYILNNTGPCGKIIKKQILIDNELFFLENHFYEDLAIVPAYGLFCEVGFIDKPLYYYEINDGSIMNQINYNPHLEDIYNAIDSLYHVFESNKRLNDYFPEIEYLYIQHLLKGAGLRFLNFKQSWNNLEKSSKILKCKFKYWRKNNYYKNMPLKYKLMCNLLYFYQLSFVLKWRKK